MTNNCWFKNGQVTKYVKQTLVNSNNKPPILAPQRAMETTVYNLQNGTKTTIKNWTHKDTHRYGFEEGQPISDLVTHKYTHILEQVNKSTIGKAYNVTRQ